MKEFKINEYITLKLEDYIPNEGLLGSLINFITKNIFNLKNKSTVIYVNGERFDQCKFILLDVPVNENKISDELGSIDEAAEKLDHSMEINFHNSEVTPEIEFWAHCSNLQAWAETNYDTRLLHRNLAFPLLKKLADAGDLVAKKVFKEEIAKRFASGHISVINYLLEQGYLTYLNKFEIESIIEELEKGSTNYVLCNNEKIFVVHNDSLELSSVGIREIRNIRNLDKLTEINKLNLSFNNIKEIESLEPLKNLEVLDLSFNQITEIKGLTNLTNLKELYLQGNNITEIKGFETLTNLKKINLWLNPIRLRQIYLLLFGPQKIVQFCQNIKNA